MQKKESVLRVIKETVRKHGVLSAALLGVVCGAVIFALLPPLVLAQLIDLLTKKHTLWMEGILLYFGLLALTGLLESARESLLTVFGQKITHALRSSLMEKFGRLSANELNRHYWFLQVQLICINICINISSSPLNGRLLRHLPTPPTSQPPREDPLPHPKFRR